MIKAKALALCVCPILAAPPAVLSVAPPARHAVAHLLHRAANRLDHHAAPPHATAIAAKPLPCAPSLAAGGGGLPITGGTLIGGDSGAPPLTAIALAGDTDGPAYPYGGYGGGSYGGGYGGGGFGGGSGGGGGGGYGGGGGPGTGGPSGGVPGGPGSPIVTPPGGTPGTPSMPGNPGTPVSGAPEPAAWLLLVTGFGLVGGIARYGRVADGQTARLSGTAPAGSRAA